MNAPHQQFPHQQFPNQQHQWEQWQNLQERRYQEQQEYMRRQQGQMMMFQQKTFDLIQADQEIKKAMLEATKSHKNEKKTKCPVWDKQEPLKRYLPRLKIWNKIQTHDGKYLDLLEALQSADRKKEKDKIELEVQKGNLDPENENVVEMIIQRLEQWFGKTRIEEGSGSWRGFRDMRREENESVHDFVVRYETAEADVKANAGDISDNILVIQLLDCINVSTMERQNIVANVKYENNPDYYEDIKKSIKLLKGSLVDDKKEVSKKDNPTKEQEKDDVFFNSQRNKKYYNFKGNNSGEREGRSTFREKNWNSRGRRSSSRNQESRSSSRNGRSKSGERNYQRQYYGKRYDDKSNRRHNERDVRRYDREVEQEEIQINFSNQIDKLVEVPSNTEEVFISTEGDAKVMIIDTAATKSVVGRPWMNDYFENSADKIRKEIRVKDDERSFKF